MIEGDCLEAMRGMADRSVAHVLTDPPYDERTHTNVKNTKVGSGTLDLGFAHLDSFAFVDSLLRISAGWVVAFCALEQLGAYRDASGDAWIRAGIWNRTAGAAFARSDRPFQGAEGIAIASRAPVKVFPAGAKRAVWSCTTERQDRGHPTQKPLDLMLELVRDFTLRDDVILDPFCGSGTTGVAALRLGRRAVLVEKDARHAELARERMRAEGTCNTLQAQRVGQMPLLGGG